MEVETDDDLIESPSLIEARTRGPPPDVTHILPTQQTRYHKKTNLTDQHTTSTTPKSSNNIHYISTSHRSSNENQPLLSDSANLSDNEAMETLSDFIHLSCNHFEHDPQFNEIIKQVEYAIDHNILPQRIYEGSSGSYFAKNSEYVIDFVLSILF
jgi:hypothetical protein